MSIHLSPDQMSELLISEATPESQRHIQECIDCREEVAKLRATLGVLHDSVRNWSADVSATINPERSSIAHARRPFGIRIRPWAAACALIALLAIPIYRNVHHRQLELRAAEDSLLLEHVNTHLSRSVPAPMEPLMRLISDLPEEPAGGHK